MAGERFCVRNSGATAVVEGIGDHGCEYMTGGIALILGDIGRNFAAGMSGGIAYIYKEGGDFDERNFKKEMIEFEEPNSQDLDLIKKLIEDGTYTSSELAKDLISNWDIESKQFIKIMPTEYKLALEKMAKELEIIN